MAWWQIKPKIVSDFLELTSEYNKKYGNYDYRLDSRFIDSQFETKFFEAVGDLTRKNILICGSNSGYEIELILKKFPDAQITALDISTEALQKSSIRFPHVTHTHGDIQNLPYKDKQFDVYLSFRAIHSSSVNIEKAVAEATRVASGEVVLSISNGYIVENAIVNGMYDYDSNRIDSEKPVAVSKKISELLGARGYVIEELNSESEIFLRAEPA